MADNPTALYYNPAGIAFAHGTNIYVEGLFALRSLSFTRDPGGIDNPGVSPGTPDIRFNSGKNTALNLIASPFLGITSDLGVPNLGVGLSLSVPFGGQAAWDKQNDLANPMYPGAVDGSQRWWDIEGLIHSIYFTAGAAYKLPHDISIGIGLNVVNARTDDMRAADATGNDDLTGPNNTIAEGRAILDTATITFSIGAGIMWEPIPELRIGFSYQSQPGFGTITEDGTLTKNLGQAGSSKNDVEQKYSLPDVYRLGVSWRATPKIALRLWGSFERWSVFQRQCIINKEVATRSCDKFTATGSAPADAGVINSIPRGWQDAGSLRASGSYYLNDNVELQLGVGWDGDAVPDKALEYSLPDDTKINATVGAVFRNVLADRLQIHVSYSAFFALDRTITPDQYVRFDFPSRVPNAAGTFTQFIGLFELGVGYGF